MAVRVSLVYKNSGTSGQAVSSDFNSSVGWNSICQAGFAVSHSIAEGLAHETGFPVYLETRAPLEI